MKIKTLKTVLGHPLNQGKKMQAFFKLLKRGLAFRLHPFPMVYPFVENTWLVVERGMSSAELQLYTYLYDTEEMLFLMHFLREEDTFVDIGANVGVYTILAAGVAGAKVVSAEPVPVTFERLRRNVEYNRLTGKVTLKNLGLGDKQSELLFSSGLDAVNHVVDRDFKGEAVKVAVETLDALLGAGVATAVKIDVEGYEANVINGAGKVLSDPSLKALIMETNGLSDQYEFGQDYLHRTLLSYEFLPYSYDPYRRELKELSGPGAANTLYLRDVTHVLERIRTGRKVRIGDRLI